MCAKTVNSEKGIHIKRSFCRKRINFHSENQQTMFVTVFLVEARAHIVIPQKFVYELNQMNLCNNGINTNQNRRIFFSTQLLNALENGEVIHENEYAPNFNLPITGNYPLPDDMLETCFIARLKKFWGEYRNTEKYLFFWRPNINRL